MTDQICSVDACERTDIQGREMCRLHYFRWYRHGTTELTRKPPKPRVLKGLATGERNANWSGEDATYGAVHLRLRKARGPARKQNCVDCGAGARHWSYNRSGIAEKSAPDGPYSVDLDQYEPRCVRCHKLFDLPEGWVSPSRTVTESAVRYIVERRICGVSQAAIAKELGISQSTVWRKLRSAGVV